MYDRIKERLGLPSYQRLDDKGPSKTGTTAGDRKSVGVGTHKVSLAKVPEMPEFLTSRIRSNSASKVWQLAASKRKNEADLHDASAVILRGLGIKFDNVSDLENTVPLKDLCRLFCSVGDSNPIASLPRHIEDGSTRFKVSSDLSDKQVTALTVVVQGLVEAGMDRRLATQLLFDAGATNERCLNVLGQTFKVIARQYPEARSPGALSGFRDASLACRTVFLEHAVQAMINRGEGAPEVFGPLMEEVALLHGDAYEKDSAIALRADQMRDEIIAYQGNAEELAKKLSPDQFLDMMSMHSRHAGGNSLTVKIASEMDPASFSKSEQKRDFFLLRMRGDSGNTAAATRDWLEVEGTPSRDELLAFAATCGDVMDLDPAGLKDFLNKAIQSLRDRGVPVEPEMLQTAEARLCVRRPLTFDKLRQLFTLPGAVIKREISEADQDAMLEAMLGMEHAELVVLAPLFGEHFLCYSVDNGKKQRTTSSWMLDSILTPDKVAPGYVEPKKGAPHQQHAVKLASRLLARLWESGNSDLQMRACFLARQLAVPRDGQPAHAALTEVFLQLQQAHPDCLKGMQAKLQELASYRQLVCMSGKDRHAVIMTLGVCTGVLNSANWISNTKRDHARDAKCKPNAAMAYLGLTQYLILERRGDHESALRQLRLLQLTNANSEFSDYLSAANTMIKRDEKRAKSGEMGLSSEERGAAEGIAGQAYSEFPHDEAIDFEGHLKVEVRQVYEEVRDRQKQGAYKDVSDKALSAIDYLKPYIHI